MRTPAPCERFARPALDMPYMVFCAFAMNAT